MKITVERTSENKNGFLAKDAAIVLTGSTRFSATCCCKYVSENLFSGTRLPVNKTTRMYRDATKWNELSPLSNLQLIICYVSRDSDRSINYSIERVSEYLSGWLRECA